MIRQPCRLRRGNAGWWGQVRWGTKPRGGYVLGAGLGDWADRAGQVAGWTEGGWRFASPVDGMRLFDRATGSNLLFRSESWIGAMTAPVPSGGDVIDQEARDSISTIIAALHQAGLLLAN